uniref:Uncharacterized protein n=1 Tax=Spongospora subterranea TaxID=70186 RepID=A0A0H5QUK8_9EUKA|eukprot:CRZ05422.1 hypothetical protein [Spongospora subterranea]
METIQLRAKVAQQTAALQAMNEHLEKFKDFELESSSMVTEELAQCMEAKSQLSVKNESLMRTIENQAHTIELLLMKRVQSTAEYDELKDSFVKVKNEYEDRIRSHETEYAAMESAAKNAESKLISTQSTLSRLQLQIESNASQAEKEVQSYEARISESALTVESLRQELLRSVEESTALRSQLDSALNRQSSLELENQRLSSEALSSFTNSHELETSRDDALNTYSELNALYVDCLAAHERLTNENKALRERSTSDSLCIEQLGAKTAELSHKLVALDAKMIEIEDENRRLRREEQLQAAELSSSQQFNAKLMDKIAQLYQHVEQATRLSLNFQEQLNQHRDQIDSVNANVFSLEGKEHKLRCQVDSVQQNLVKITCSFDAKLGLLNNVLMALETRSLRTSSDFKVQLRQNQGLFASQTTALAAALEARTQEHDRATALQRQYLAEKDGLEQVIRTLQGSLKSSDSQDLTLWDSFSSTGSFDGNGQGKCLLKHCTMELSQSVHEIITLVEDIKTQNAKSREAVKILERECSESRIEVAHQIEVSATLKSELLSMQNELESWIELSDEKDATQKLTITQLSSSYNSKLNEATSRLEREIKLLTESLHDSKNVAKESQELVVFLKQQMSDLHHEYVSVEANFEQERMQFLAQGKSKFDEAQAGWELQVSDLTRSLSDSKKASQEFQDEALRLKQLLIQLQEDHHAVNSEYELTINNLISENNLKFNQNQTEWEHRTSVLTESLTASKELVHQLQDYVSRLEQELSKLHENHDVVKAEYELQNLESSILECQRLRDEVVQVKEHQGRGSKSELSALLTQIENQDSQLLRYQTEEETLPLASEITQSESSLSLLMTRADNAELLCKRFQKSEEILKLELDQKGKAIIHLQTVNEATQLTLNSSIQIFHSCMSRIDELELDNFELSDQVGVYSSRLDLLEAELNTHHLRRAQSDDERHRIQQFMEHLSQLRVSHVAEGLCNEVQYRAECQQLSAKVRFLRDFCRRYHDFFNERCESFFKSVSYMHDKLEVKTIAFDELLRTTAASLNSQVNGHLKLSQKNNDLSGSLENYRKNLQLLQDELQISKSEIATMHDEMESYAAEYNSEELSKVATQLADSEKRNSDLQSSLNSVLANVRSQKDVVEAQSQLIAALENDNDKLTKKLNDQSGIDQQLQNYSAEITFNKKQFSDFETALHKLETEYKDTVAQLNYQSQSELKKMSELLVASESQWKSESQALQKTVTSLQAVLDKERSQSEQKVSQCRQMLKADKDTIAKLISQQQDIERKFHDLSEQLRVRHVELGETRDRCTALQEKNDDFINRRKDTEAIMERSEEALQQIQSLKQELSATSAELLLEKEQNQEVRLRYEQDVASAGRTHSEQIMSINEEWECRLADMRESLGKTFAADLQSAQQNLKHVSQAAEVRTKQYDFQMQQLQSNLKALSSEHHSLQIMLGCSQGTIEDLLENRTDLENKLLHAYRERDEVNVALRSLKNKREESYYEQCEASCSLFESIQLNTMHIIGMLQHEVVEVTRQCRLQSEQLQNAEQANSLLFRQIHQASQLFQYRCWCFQSFDAILQEFALSPPDLNKSHPLASDKFPSQENGSGVGIYQATPEAMDPRLLSTFISWLDSAASLSDLRETGLPIEFSHAVKLVEQFFVNERYMLRTDQSELIHQLTAQLKQCTCSGRLTSTERNGFSGDAVFRALHEIDQNSSPPGVFRSQIQFLSSVFQQLVTGRHPQNSRETMVVDFTVPSNRPDALRTIGRRSTLFCSQCGRSTTMLARCCQDCLTQNNPNSGLVERPNVYRQWELAQESLQEEISQLRTCLNKAATVIAELESRLEDCSLEKARFSLDLERITKEKQAYVSLLEESVAEIHNMEEAERDLRSAHRVVDDELHRSKVLLIGEGRAKQVFSRRLRMLQETLSVTRDELQQYRQESVKLQSVNKQLSSELDIARSSALDKSVQPGINEVQKKLQEEISSLSHQLQQSAIKCDEAHTLIKQQKVELESTHRDNRGLRTVVIDLQSLLKRQLRGVSAMIPQAKFFIKEYVERESRFFSNQVKSVLKLINAQFSGSALLRAQLAELTDKEVLQSQALVRAGRQLKEFQIVLSAQATQTQSLKNVLRQSEQDANNLRELIQEKNIALRTLTTERDAYRNNKKQVSDSDDSLPKRSEDGSDSKPYRRYVNAVTPIIDRKLP